MPGREKTPRQKKKKAPDNREPEAAARRKHPDQKQAEQEEKRTLKEKKARTSRASKPGVKERPTSENEKETTPEAETPSGEDTEKRRIPIVAVGASAGGLEALERFFDSVPDDSGMTFVVITHTSPEHESMLPGLIKRKSKIPVEVIRDDMPAEPNIIYLPPSDRDPILEKGVFSLKKRPAKSEIHLPVNLFLRYLAQERGEFAACVILSGTGTDGTLGLRQIKENGGLAVAQSPDSARHTGMPRSAIDTGLVDVVAAPSEMPDHLMRYFKHPGTVRLMPEEDKETDPLRRILIFLATRTQHDFSLYKENTLIRRIERRMTINRSENGPDYIELLRRDPDEVRALFQDLLIGVTSFFRDPEAFAFIKQTVLPDLVSRTNNDPLRIWIPGCATGEEAYSVAILLKEFMEEKEIRRDAQVFGTDIDGRAIEKARFGLYLQNIVSDVSPERLKRFFIREESRYRVVSDIRGMVVFAEQNLLSDPPFSRLDLLVCRNLLIYLKPEAQNRLIPLFHYALRESGVLFLGNAESVGRYHDHFEPVSKHHSIYRRQNHRIHPMIEFPPAKRLRKFDEKTEAGKEQEKGIREAVEKFLIQAHTPACVVVNRMGEILHFHGRTSRYLEQPGGEPTVLIFDLAREGLRVALLSALRRAEKDKEEIREKDVRVKVDHEFRRIELVIKSFSRPPLTDCRLVIFEELPESVGSGPQAADHETGGKDTRRENELEEELMRVRQDYRSAMEEIQTANEELRSSNEELHSSNEELQSTNEELESSREELQSLNEELNTVNSELNSKIEDLHEAYNAVSSVLNSTRIAIVFLDNELRIKRFTPEATQLLNLIDSDVGRPLDHISHKMEYENLLEKVSQVMKNLSSIDEEILTRDGHWYRMRIMVYRTEKHIIEGVVLTFINIDAQKKAQEKLEKMSSEAVSSALRFAENIVDTIRESLVVLDGRMRVVKANRSFYQTFRTAEKEIMGKRFFELGSGQWDIPELKKLLQEIVVHNKTFQDYPVAHRFPDVGFKRMMLNARMLREENKKEDRILLAIEDITENPEASPEEDQ